MFVFCLNFDMVNLFVYTNTFVFDFDRKFPEIEITKCSRT